MADASLNSAEALIDGILAGQVPRQVRLFAAQGLLPVSREDLFRLQLVLSADPDAELAAMAAASLGEVPMQVLIGWIRSQSIDPMELELLARVREEQEIWIAIAQHKDVGDETFRMLASHGSPVVQDVVITNQVRVLNCLEVLEDLKSNPQVSQVVLRRVREFEEEFIAKAVAEAERDADIEEPEARVSIAEALEALRAIGAHIPNETKFPLSQNPDADLDDRIRDANQGALGKIINMGVKEKILLGMRGTREERAILINSRNRLVMRAVLASPKLNDGEVERFAGSKSVSDEVIRAIANNGRWLRHYPILWAVVQNPKAPIHRAIRLLPLLNAKDIKRLTMDRNASPIIRRQAKTRLERMKR